MLSGVGVSTLTCPYEHPRGSRPPVLVLRVADHAIGQSVGGKKIKPRIIHGLDIHCTACHFESWIRVRLDKAPANSGAPRRCSCGETVR